MAAVQVQASPASHRIDAAVRQMRAGVQAMSALIREGDIDTLGVALIQIREIGIDPLEAVFAEGVRKLDKSGEYHADGALSVVDWLRSSCKLSGGAAAERVGIARQLEKLPQTEAAFASGALGYQHVVVMARAAEHVGATAVRKEEASLLQAAQTMDPGRFTGVAKNFEHRVDAAGALAGTLGAPAGELQGGGTVPAETVQRYACDSAISRVTGRGELDHELSHAARTIPAPTRRALETRDRHCVFTGCGRPLNWCDGRHRVWWTKGGSTTLPNLALLRRRHHRMVHEEGWTLEHRTDGQWAATPPRKIPISARSA